MRRLKDYLFVTLLAISTSSCAPTITNFSPLFLKSKVETQVYKSPKIDQTKYSTFTLQPISHFKEKPLLTNGIVEMQMMFIIRNLFEYIGYLYVEPNQRSDFIITVDAVTLQDSGYIPPSTFTVPKWVPGREIVTYGTMTGTYRSWPNYMNRGCITGTTVSTTYVPGYMTNETYVLPGQYYIHNYHGVGIWVFDRANADLLFSGVGMGTSDNSDIRISVIVQVKLKQNHDVRVTLPAMVFGLRHRSTNFQMLSFCSRVK